MKFKTCTFCNTIVAFISLRFGRGAQVEKTSLLEVNFQRCKRRRWAYSFFIWYTSEPGIPQNPSILEEDEAFFSQCEAKIVRRHTSRQRSSLVSQQRVCPRRFYNTVKRVPKLRSEPVAFLFLVCF